MDSRSRTALRSPSSWPARAPSAFAAAAASVGAHHWALASGSPLKIQLNILVKLLGPMKQRVLTSIFSRHLAFRAEIGRILEPGIKGVTRHYRISIFPFFLRCVFLSPMVVSPAAAGVRRRSRFYAMVPVSFDKVCGDSTGDADPFSVWLIRFLPLDRFA